MALYTNDDNMTYDLENHRYVLTENGFKKYSGYSLRDRLDLEDMDQDIGVKFFLNRVSENVYGLLQIDPGKNVRSIECYLAIPENRVRVYNALCREASDMMVANKDPSEDAKSSANPCSVGLKIILAPLYGTFALWRDYEYGVDY